MEISKFAYSESRVTNFFYLCGLIVTPMYNTKCAPQLLSHTCSFLVLLLYSVLSLVSSKEWNYRLGINANFVFCLSSKSICHVSLFRYFERWITFEILMLENNFGLKNQTELNNSKLILLDLSFSQAKTNCIFRTFKVTESFWAHSKVSSHEKLVLRSGVQFSIYFGFHFT